MSLIIDFPKNLKKTQPQVEFNDIHFFKEWEIIKNSERLRLDINKLKLV